jgi:hypothetical protein
MKYLLFFLLIFASCSVPSKVVTTYTTDSMGRTVKTVQKFYSDSTVRTNIIYETPYWWYRPYYYYTPRIYYYRAPHRR